MTLPFERCEEVLQELIEGQQKKMLTFAQEIHPHLSLEDLLQPNDYPELEHHPYFRYLEGMLQGVLSTQMALRSLVKQQSTQP